LIYFQYTLQNYSLTDAVQQISESYKCKPIEGMLSHELKQFKIDGEKTIIQNPSEAQRKEHEKCTFETYEVYAIDVIVSSGEGVVSNPSKIPIFSTLCSMIKNKRLRLTWLECGVCSESVLYARRVYVVKTRHVQTLRSGYLLSGDCKIMRSENAKKKLNPCSLGLETQLLSYLFSL